MLYKRKIALILLAFCCVSLTAFSTGCKKKAPVVSEPEPPPPPPPPPPKPAVTLTAEPSSIERGKSATLKWTSENATSASLNQGIGAVPVNGSREVFPTQTTEYTITVKGEGGSATARANVNVRVPPPPPPPPPPKPTFDETLTKAVKDIYFDFDRSEVRPDAEQTLRSNATAMRRIFQDYPQGRIVIEGHCDERGTNEYNLALGDRRATAAREFLVSSGLPAVRMQTISYGEERPQCTESTESCWQLNRRAHFTAK